MGALISEYDAATPVFLQNPLAMFIIAIIAFAGAGLIIWKGKGLTYNYRLLIAMLVFFIGTIALGNAFFIRMTRGPLAPFQVYESGVVNGQGTFQYADFQDAYLYTDQQASLVNPQAIQKQLKVLVIELEGENRITFTEENYPVEKILADIQTAYASFREKND